MSTPFEFTYQGPSGFDPSRTVILGRLLDAYTIETYGDDNVVMGILAFDDDKNLIGLRVENHGPLGKSPEGKADWDGTVAWLKELGAPHFFTFVRRSPDFGYGAQPTAWDVGLIDITSQLADGESGLTYQGHIITDGTDHTALPRAHVHSSGRGISQLMDMVNPETQAEIGQAALDKLLALGEAIGVEVHPSIIEATELGITRIREGRVEDPLTDEEEALLERSIVELDKLHGAAAAKLTGKDAAQAFAPKQDDERPSVPPAFYN